MQISRVKSAFFCSSDYETERAANYIELCHVKTSVPSLRHVTDLEYISIQLNPTLKHLLPLRMNVHQFYI